ncbi:OLC1v1027569C3 [Oldenlandia corymbosa var. corymbosa]|uniref:Hexosyltransferase n=1 Tax=Oldenlandia corymbosa var. corymbosa TaxID=529605 RepID=A0AAV1CCS8_OLDCO|nr:OLC1v1027569C3 [Oldenlandia corymbosa var. corymbosa]
MTDPTSKRKEMQSKMALSNRHSSGIVIRSSISTLMLSMFATLASFYIAGRLWQDAEGRVYLTKELDRITGQGHSAISVDDTLKIIACREQRKKLSAIEMELEAARQEGFVSSYLVEKDKISDKRPLVVIGVLTRFDRKNNRDAIRKAWMASGRASKKLEDQKGIIARFVIGRRFSFSCFHFYILFFNLFLDLISELPCSSNRGDSFDRNIDIENKQTNDLFILENYVEKHEEQAQKTKLFFSLAAEYWNADFYAKVNDDVYVNIDAFGTTLASYAGKPRVYMGCMKSGEVFSEQSHRWYEPDWWKFGDGKVYFRHASGEMFVISKALAKFININRSILRAYAHGDVTVGSWFIGADVEHIDERKLCCSSWSTGAICSGV